MKTSRDPVDLAKYLSDESRMTGGAADEVIWPETPAEAAAALAQCVAGGAPVTVSGAGTGVVGGRVPLGGVVLATDRLNRILDLSADPAGGGVVRVQAGATLAAVQEAAAAAGLWLPPDPTESGCFIGGALACNASGARSFRYGAIRRWVTRLVVALTDGSQLELLRGQAPARGGAFHAPRRGGAPLTIPAPNWGAPATTKHAAGYYSAPDMDLVDLFVGAEGTLGVILEADLKLVSAPAALISGVLFFGHERAALEFVGAARGDRRVGAFGVTPAALEFFDDAALALLREQGAPTPRGGGAAIFFEQPVLAAGDFDGLLEAWAILAEERGALAESWLAQNPAEQQRFREFRHLVPWTINETIARRKVRKVSTDTAVPPGRAAELLARCRALVDAAGLECVAFGHIGDDHLHINLLPRDQEQLPAAKQLYARMVRVALDLGGTISAEHGLGKLKAPDLPLLYGPAALNRMRAIKRILDPAGLLGRGTLFAD